MNDRSRFDPAHDAAIRAVLVDTARQTRPRPRRGHRVAFVVAIAAACALVIGGGSFAAVSLHARPRHGGDAAAPTSSSPTPAPTRTGAAPSQPAGNVEGAGSPTATPVAPVPSATVTPTPAPTPTVAPTAELPAPVILTPTAGQALRGSPLTVVFSGTGTPGTHVYLAEYCTLAPPACTMPQEFGQPGQPQIVVGADGRWSVSETTSPAKALGFTVTATAARVDAAGNPVADSSGHEIPARQSNTVTFSTGPAGS